MTTPTDIAKAAAALRAPFPPELIGKLPKLTCKDCSNAADKQCGKHSKSKCGECGNWISSAHIHLDYVGHAATTDRLLQVDPAWTWRPFTREERADVEAQPGDLWIWLTIAGVTRPGVGDGKSAKERIGDAIRNAAMRFGVGLDLWSKEDLRDKEDKDEQPPAAEPAPAAPPAQTAFQAPATNGGKKITKAQQKQIEALVENVAAMREVTLEQAWAAITNDNGVVEQLSHDKATELIGKLERWESNLKTEAGVLI